LYWAGSLVSVPKELSKYKLVSVGVPKRRWEGSSATATGKYEFFYGQGNK
jgi:hypothetical protein